ncbi:MAG: Rpp14/Pop5 family protein [Nanoarchaeota archaeon]
MNKIKILLPSLRERKRYIEYRVIGGFVEKEFLYSMIKRFIGELGMGKAGARILNHNGNKGIIRVNNKHVDEVKMALALINNYNDKEIKVECTKVSGVLRKLKEDV